MYRLAGALGIHKALRYMFSAPERGYEMGEETQCGVRRKSALDKGLLMQGAPTDIAEVRAYLDAERAGW